MRSRVRCLTTTQISNESSQRHTPTLPDHQPTPRQPRTPSLSTPGPGRVQAPPGHPMCQQTLHYRQNAAICTTPATVCLFIVCGVSNRVTYKMTLVPMKEYIFFMAQFLSLVYCSVYIPILAIRYRMGIVTKEMLAIPKFRYVIIGISEALATLLLLTCTSNLPGIILPILSQLILLWQMVLSIFILKRQYALNQYIGVVLVMTGSMLAAAATSTVSSVGSTSLRYMLLLNVVYILYGFVSVTKEQIFTESRQILGGKSLDVFVVNSFGSIAQVLGTVCLFPFLLRARDMAMHELPRYLTEGGHCLCGTSLADGVDCSGAPLLPMIYIVCNLSLNISFLYLVRQLGVVVTSISSSFIIPATVAVFTLNLPYLGAGPSLSPTFLTGCAFLIAGMFVYAFKDIVQPQKQQTTPSTS